MTYAQVIPDVARYDFDFTDWFLSTDTISAISVAATPSGLVEVTAGRSTKDVTQTIYISSALASANTYTLSCQATSSSGIKRTITKTIVVSAEPAGITAVSPATAASGMYSATLAQSGTDDPTVTVVNSNTLIAGTPTWTRYSEGKMRGSLTGAFVENKTRVIVHLVPYLVGNEDRAYGNRIDDDTVEVEIRDFGGNLVDGFSVLHVDLVTYD